MYRLANLLKWKKRKVCLADVGDWLDLLDDFGPALLHFVVDERFATTIPESDPVLATFRESMRSAPLSTLKPSRGTVWILFVFKDDLATLPEPFRKEGLLLPFVWVRDGITEPCVPTALAALASRVRGQFGVEAEGWQLAPADYFDDDVDFEISGATFDSAWGALASGLYLALHPEVKFVAWPFSSVAFDFARGEPAPVGGLEAKFRVAASFGAEEIAVAPVQRGEAENRLAKLKAESRGDRNLKRLKIYSWRWTGDLRRSLPLLVRCNQLNGKRKILRMVFANLVLVLGVLTGIGFFAWDWHCERTMLYRDYVEQRGLAEGLFPLKEGERLAYAYRFHWRGYDALNPFCRKPVLRAVWCVNVDGRVETDRTNRPEHRSVAGREFVYADDGRLKEVRHLDDKGKVIDIFRYSGRNWEVADVVSIDESEVVRLGAVEYTTSSGRQGDRVRRIAYERDDEGRTVGVTSQADMSGTVARSGTGIAKVSFRLDECGRVIESRYLTEAGEAAVDMRGVHRKQYVYRSADLVECSRFSADGTLKERMSYADDVRHHLTVFHPNGGRDEHEYDDKGRCARVEYRAADGRLEADGEGVAVVVYSYLPDGRRTETRYDVSGCRIEVKNEAE